MNKFHFFNDNKGWQYIDKFGHTFTSYFIGKYGIEFLEWADIKEKKALWFGGCLGFAFLSSVEVFDGFSTGWGPLPEIFLQMQWEQLFL
jgi:hypothetical protein